MSIVYTKSYPAPEYRASEILRYAGVQSASPEILQLMNSCLTEAADKLVYKVCWQEFPVSVQNDLLDLSFTKTPSADLKRNLQDCDSIVLFAATVGIELDRLITRYGSIAPSRAHMLQAIGSERIEALCDAFNLEITQEKAAAGKQTAFRFSPGYGDLPLETQKDIFRVLDCPRKIGVALNENLFMSPSKSVTAIIGVGNPKDAGTKGCGDASRCASCPNLDCAFRRTI